MLPTSTTLVPYCYLVVLLAVHPLTIVVKTNPSLFIGKCMCDTSIYSVHTQYYNIIVVDAILAMCMSCHKVLVVSSPNLCHDNRAYQEVLSTPSYCEVPIILGFNIYAFLPTT